MKIRKAGECYMALLSVKCTHCGANLELNSDNQWGKCPYCGSEFRLQDDITNCYDLGRECVDDYIKI